MSSLQNMVGETDIRFTNAARDVDQLRNEMVEEIEGWVPSGDPYQLNEYDICRLEGGSGRFSSSVEWSTWAMGDVRSSSSRWHAGGGDVFVADSSLTGSDLGLIFPCGIKGAPSEQLEEIPLEIRVGRVGSPKFSDEFQEGLAITLADSMRDELGCVNRPDMPDDLVTS